MDLLKGITIIDFTRLLPGPVATHMLAQMGATVIKIESPKRPDYVREGMLQIDGASVLFHQLNHNKQLKSIDYNSPEGKNEVLKLIAKADVVIEQFRPGTMDYWLLGYEHVKEVNPEIIYASISGYGKDTPLSSEAGHDANYLAYSGLLSLFVDKTGKPNVPAAQIADVCGAYVAIQAIQAALIKKLKSGKGSHLDIALCDAIVPLLSLPYGLYGSGLDHRKFNIFNGFTAANYTTYQCSDGRWLAIGALEMKFWNTFCELVERPDWKRKDVIELMGNNFPRQEIIDLFKTKTTGEWLELFYGQDTCIAPVLELEELEEFPYHIARETFESIKTSGGEELKTIAIPFKVL